MSINRALISAESPDGMGCLEAATVSKQDKSKCIGVHKNTVKRRDVCLAV